MIKIEITADTTAQARQQLAELLGANPPMETTTVPLEPAPKGRAPRAEKSVVPQSDVSAAKEQDISVAGTKTGGLSGSANDASRSDDDTSEEGVWDYQTQIKPAVLKVSQKLGRTGVVTLLEPFGVDNASKIPPERHGELMAAIDKMLEA